VALCTYNGAAYLGAQLASVAAQSRCPDELVVGDDGSRDATVEIVRAFAATAPFPVRLEVNARNVGSTTNFEAVVGRCAGDVIALADQDDVWHPRKLERLEAALAGAPAAGAAFSDARLVDGALRPLGRTLWEEIGLDAAMRRELAEGRGLRLLTRKSVVTGATMLFRAAERPLLLPVSPRAVHDAWFALLLAAVGPVVSVDEPLIDYRQHGANQIGAAQQTLGDRARAVRRPRRMGDVADFAAWLGEAAARLETQRARVIDHGALDRLHDLADHLGARASLPASRPRRMVPVLREALAGRYGRYSNGILSVLKDLAR
jgi:glycosyltransferase involved in cell wall biosynthesis